VKRFPEVVPASIRRKRIDGAPPPLPEDFVLPELLLEEELEDELELLLEDDELDEELLDEEELEDELDPLLDEELELPEDDEELEL